MACTIDESSLPLLTGCPGDSEWVSVGNAVGGLDANGGNTIGYARRLWGDIKACMAGSIKFVFNQFTIGDPNSPMNAGDTTLTINQTNIISGSAFVTLSGPELPQSNNTQISYVPTYNSNNIIFTFNQGVSNGQIYIIHYAYLGSGVGPIAPSGFVTGNSIQSGTGVDLQYKIPHGLGVVPSYISVDAGSSAASNISNRTADATYIYVNYGASPPLGANNLTFYWSARV